MDSNKPNKPDKPDDYYVKYNIGGIVGGSENIVNNTFQTGQPTFDNAGIDDAPLKQGHRNLLILELIDKYIEPLSQKVDDALRLGRYPLQIQITDLFIDCANGTYYNGGNRDSEVEQVINGLFTLICISRGFNYKAKIARVGPNYFFEMYPND